MRRLDGALASVQETAATTRRVLVLFPSTSLPTPTESGCLPLPSAEAAVGLLKQAFASKSRILKSALVFRQRPSAVVCRRTRAAATAPSPLAIAKMMDLAGDVVVMTATAKWNTTTDNRTTWPTSPSESALCQMACPTFHRAFDFRIPTLLEGPEQSIFDDTQEM